MIDDAVLSQLLAIEASIKRGLKDISSKPSLMFPPRPPPGFTQQGRTKKRERG